MKEVYAFEDIEVPAGVTVTVESRKVVVKGKYGELTREFRGIPVSIEVAAGKKGKGQVVRVSSYFPLARQVSCLRTVCSHIGNMFTGVTKKFEYKMRLVYAHFPINVTMANADKTVEIRNFLGEKFVRTIDMIGDTKCVKSGDVKDELILTGTDLPAVSRSAALIHQSCLVKKKDIRKFLDGIYVSSTGTVDLE